MTQLALFDGDTVPTPSWLCPYERQCTPKGRAVWSEPIDHGDCINRVCRCMTCGKHGEESRAK